MLVCLVGLLYVNYRHQKSQSKYHKLTKEMYRELSTQIQAHLNEHLKNSELAGVVVLYNKGTESPEIRYSPRLGDGGDSDCPPEGVPGHRPGDETG